MAKFVLDNVEFFLEIKSQYHFHSWLLMNQMIKTNKLNSKCFKTVILSVAQVVQNWATGSRELSSNPTG